MIFGRKLKGFGWCVRLWIKECHADPPDDWGYNPDYFFDSSCVDYAYEFKGEVEQAWDNGNSGFKYVAENCRDWKVMDNPDHIYRISYSRTFFEEEDIAGKAKRLINTYNDFKLALDDFIASMSNVHKSRRKRDKWLDIDNPDFDSNFRNYSKAGIKLDDEGNPVPKNDDARDFYKMRNYFLKNGIEIDEEGNIVG